MGTFLVLGSALIQGLTLKLVVDRAALAGHGEENDEEEAARDAMRQAADEPAPENDNAHDAARQALIGLRERDRIGDEMLVRMLRETDLHARAAEDNALPGAGPPNP